MTQDLRSALRALRQNLPMTLLAVVSLTLAIAGNTTAFSLVNSLLLRPFPFAAPERLLQIWEQPRDAPTQGPAPSSFANFLDWQSRCRQLTGMAAYRFEAVTLTQGDHPERLTAEAVTSTFFELLGVPPARGRSFSEREGLFGNHRVTILSDGFWKKRFAADPGILGRSISLDGEPYTVVGIMPQDFESIEFGAELWIPLAPDLARLDRGTRDVSVIARLGDGQHQQQVQEELDEITTQLEREFPEANESFVAHTTPLQEPPPTTRLMLFSLQGAMIFVLLIACANIANLLLARSQSRRRELGIRMSLGAGKGRIMRQLMGESLLLAALGGLAGGALGLVATRLLAAFLAGLIPSYHLPSLDLRVMAFTAGITLGAGLLFGLAPLTQVLQRNAAEALKEGTRGGGSAPARRFMARVLIVAEIALALVLLSGAGLFVRGFLQLQKADPGFETENLLTIQMALPESRYADETAMLTIYERLLERLERLPQVAAASATSSLPRSLEPLEERFEIDARPVPPGYSLPRAIWLSTAPGYLEAMGIPLRRGRFFRPSDRADAPPVVILSRTFARRFWVDRSPVGERVTIFGQSREVIGVANDVLQGLLFDENESRPAIYLPLAQHPVRSLSLVVRPRAAPETLHESIRREVAALDSQLAPRQIITFDRLIANYLVGPRLYRTLLTGFGLLALLLAAIGTYGVLAYSVAQRRHEIGVRMALGARRDQVVMLFAGQGLRLALIGMLLGAPGVFAVSQIVASVLANQAPLDPRTLLWVVLLLLSVTALACILPARRAASVDPLLVLRCE